MKKIIMTLLAAVMVVCANAQSTKSIAKSAAKAAGEAALFTVLDVAVLLVAAATVFAVL